LIFRAFSLYDIQFEQAKFTKKPKKGRKKKEDDNNKENIEQNVNKLIGYYNNFYETQMIQLETQLKFFYYLNQTTFKFNKISCDQQLLQQQQQQLQQQQQYFSIFNTTNSILLAKPQTIKKPRAINRGKKNSTALQF
jgi:hypothetical protein